MPAAKSAIELLQAGRPQEAIRILETSLEAQPADAGGWFLLGACQHALKNLSAAAGAFSRSLSLDPSNPQVHLAFVSTLREAGDLRGALAAGQHGLRRLPGNAHLLYAIALCLEDGGQWDDALAHYETALDVAPCLEDALHNKGILLARLGRLEEAAAHQRHYVELFPDAVRAHSGLADALLALGRFSEAIEALDVVSRLAPHDVTALVRRGVAFASIRRFDESRQASFRAQSLDADAVSRYLQRVSPGSKPEEMLLPENVFLARAWAALGVCDWSGWNDFVDVMRGVAKGPTIAIEPAVSFMCRLTPLSGAERHAVARHVAARIEAGFPALPIPTSRTRPRVRIGVLSPDFREHLNAYLLRPFFELANRSRFELYAYSLAPDDGSAIRASVAAAADTFRDLQTLGEREAALAIRNDDIDILLDVGGHTTGARFAITAQRPARLQVNYLGFSCSLASRRIDYAITDRAVGSDDTEWSEARAFLPDTHFLYDFRQPTPSTPVSRAEYGLPRHAFVYCAFHRAEKISPDAFDLWMNVLSQVPDSVLWFRALSEKAADALRAHAVLRRIDPVRLYFAPFEPSQDPRYLARQQLGDLMLDALHHNATTTACDALGVGLPVLTLQGSAMAARAGESLLRAAHLPELVASNPGAYVETAVRLARDRAALRSLTDRLVANRSNAPLFDTAARVRALEQAFLVMYERWARGVPASSFDV